MTKCESCDILTYRYSKVQTSGQTEMATPAKRKSPISKKLTRKTGSKAISKGATKVRAELRQLDGGMVKHAPAHHILTLTPIRKK